jgi:hypothetical protein
LVSDVLSDDFFVATYGRDEKAACAEMFAYKIVLSLAERSGDVDS